MLNATWVDPSWHQGDRYPIEKWVSVVHAEESERHEIVGCAKQMCDRTREGCGERSNLNRAFTETNDSDILIAKHFQRLYFSHGNYRAFESGFTARLRPVFLFRIMANRDDRRIEIERKLLVARRNVQRPTVRRFRHRGHRMRQSNVNSVMRYCRSQIIQHLGDGRVLIGLFGPRRIDKRVLLATILQAHFRVSQRPDTTDLLRLVEDGTVVTKTLHDLGECNPR